MYEGLGFFVQTVHYNIFYDLGMDCGNGERRVE